MNYKRDLFAIMPGFRDIIYFAAAHWLDQLFGFISIAL